MIALPLRGYDVLVNVTNICDARCVMCNIWKNRDMGKSYLTPEMLRTVKPLSTVSFAGGEPFLHKQIVDIVREVHNNNPRAKVVFSTNGFRTEQILAKVQDILAFHRNLQVTISLDGLGEVHDRIRGVPGAWEKVNRTFDRLGEIGLGRRNFGTITSENYRSLPDVYDYARKRGAGFSPAIAQSSKYLNVEVPHIEHDKVYEVLAPIVRENLRSWSPLNWVRAFFLYGSLRYLATGKRIVECDAFEGQFMIDQTGDVLSCHPIMLKAGSLADQPLSEILKCPLADKLRADVRKCHACWEICTARSGIRKHLWKVSLWAIWNKLLAHLGLWDGRKPSWLFPVRKEQPA